MRLYLNNAATSYPKPPSVAAAMVRTLSEAPANPYREATPGGDPAARCRAHLARMLGAPDPRRVVFCSGATAALNAVLGGLPRQRVGVLTTEVEHNSVLRPLYRLRAKGARLTIAPADSRGHVSVQALAERLTEDTGLVVVSQASNVTGSVQDVEGLHRLLAPREIPLVIDGAQGIGSVPLDLSQMPLAVAVFTGHKALHGPPGVGGFVAGAAVEPEPWNVGGSGIHSNLETMPEFWPLRHEPGTPNLPAIAGLEAALEVHSAQPDERPALVRHVVEGLAALPGARVFAGPAPENRCGIVSFVLGGWPVADLGQVLDESFDIVTRTGLHCAPLVHRALGTLPEGTVRASFSAYHTVADAERLLDALRQCRRAR